MLSVLSGSPPPPPRFLSSVMFRWVRDGRVSHKPSPLEGRRERERGGIRSCGLQLNSCCFLTRFPIKPLIRAEGQRPWKSAGPTQVREVLTNPLRVFVYHRSLRLCACAPPTAVKLHTTPATRFRYYFQSKILCEAIYLLKRTQVRFLRVFCFCWVKVLRYCHPIIFIWQLLLAFTFTFIIQDTMKQ